MSSSNNADGPRALPFLESIGIQRRIKDVFFDFPGHVSFGLTFVVTFVIYFFSMAPEVTLEFSGVATTSAKYGGVAQSPGFPVWSMYSWLFANVLPCPNLAQRVAIGSAFAASLSCGLIAWVVAAVTKRMAENPSTVSGGAGEQRTLEIVCGFISGLGFGLSTPVWKMAVVAETWALSALLFTVILSCLVQWSLDPRHTRALYLSVFFFGLLVTENEELVVVMPALLCWMLIIEAELGRDLSIPVSLFALFGWISGEFKLPWFGTGLFSGNLLFVIILIVGVCICAGTRRFASRWKTAGLCVLLFLVGLAPFLFLPVSSMTTPPTNWAYPRTVEGFFHLVSRGQYETPHPTEQLKPLLRQLWAVFGITSQNLGIWYVGCAVVPFCFIARRPSAVRNCILGLGATLLCVGPVLTAALNPGPDLQVTQLVTPYFIPMFGVLTVCAGVGVFATASLVGRVCRRKLPFDHGAATG
jgi:Protein of unknown function (DUF2723)